MSWKRCKTWISVLVERDKTNVCWPISEEVKHDSAASTVSLKITQLKAETNAYQKHF